MKVDENELIETYTTLIRLPLKDLRVSLAHKAIELKHLFKDQIEEYLKIERLIDPKSKQEATEEKAPVKQIKFEIRKKKAGWFVDPADIPREIVNHISTMDLTPGIIRMQKFTLTNGRTISLSCEMQSRGCITGSVINNGCENMTRQKKPSKQAQSTRNKTGDLKTLLSYLMNNEFLFNIINEAFLEKWKPLIDQGIINNKVIEE